MFRKLQTDYNVRNFKHQKKIIIIKQTNNRYYSNFLKFGAFLKANTFLLNVLIKQIQVGNLVSKHKGIFQT